MSLEQAIRAWDGRSADAIAAVFDRHRDDAGVVEALVALVQQRSCQRGATWLLKAGIDGGWNLSGEQASALLAQVESVDDWQAKLHVLQCLPALVIGDNRKSRLAHFLETALGDTNKLVRAWAYNGLHVLAKQHPEYREETARRLETALRDEAASVKARIRNLLKQPAGVRAG